MNPGVCPTRPDRPTFFTGDQLDDSFELALNSWYVRLVLPAEKRATVVGNEQFKISRSLCQALNLSSSIAIAIAIGFGIGSLIQIDFDTDTEPDPDNYRPAIYNLRPQK